MTETKRRLLFMFMGLLTAIGAFNVWSIAVAQASPGGTKAECAPKILKTPQVKQAKMWNPGHFGQRTIIRVYFAAVIGCDNWERLGKFRPQLKRSGRWINWYISPVWFPLGGGGPRSNRAHPAIDEDQSTPHVFDEHCEPARIQLRNYMRNAKTGKIVAKGSLKYHRINVQGC